MKGTTLASAANIDKCAVKVCANYCTHQTAANCRCNNFSYQHVQAIAIAKSTIRYDDILAVICIKLNPKQMVLIRTKRTIDILKIAESRIQ